MTQHVLSKKAVKRIRRRQDQDLKSLMLQPVGRRVMWRILDQLCNLHGASMNPSGSAVFFNEGRRDVGIQLKTELHRVCPDEFVLMLTESIPPALKPGLEELHQVDEGAPDEGPEDDE